MTRRISFSSNFPPFKLVAVTVKMKISVEREDGEKTDNLELDELITDFTVGPDGMIYGYNPFSEEYLFMFCKSSE